MFIITNGKSYITRDKENQEHFLSTGDRREASEFSYNQARNMVQGIHWIKDNGFKMYDLENARFIIPRKRRVKHDYNLDEKKEISLDSEVLEKIFNQVNSILAFESLDKEELVAYRNILSANQSKYDSAESDILHAIETYKKETGKNPQAYKMCRVYVELEDIRRKRRMVKKCLSYVHILLNSIEYEYSMERVQSELERASESEYKGRTEYYQKTLELLEIK